MLEIISALDVSYESVLDYYKELYNENSTNSYAICLINQGYDNYIDFVKKYEVNDSSMMFFLVDSTNHNYLIGYGSLETSKSIDYHKCYLNNGAISYEVRPNERKKGYGNVILDFLLQECINIGLNEICVSCLSSNDKSKKIIESHGGLLEKEFLDDDSGCFALKYWIPLKQNYTKEYKNIVSFF